VSKGVFLNLEILSHEMWDENKALGHYSANAKPAKKRTLKKLSGHIDELEKMIPKLRNEIEFLREFNQLDKN
jgi:hypothetical protein